MYAWTSPGLRTITANVWDDDNATDTFTIDVTIVNRPPAASIFVPEGGFVITEGESITFSGSDSTDSPTDRTSLQFIWDDPNTAGATQDGFGENYTIEFNTPGKFFVNLTVIDDDGKMSTATVVVEVEEKPSEGLLGMTSTTAAVSILGVVMVVLLALLLLRGRESDSEIIETKSMPDYGWDSPPAQTQEPIPTAPAEMASSGPPIPAAGLPVGWTMEQWSYYGEQYLANLPPEPSFAQPAPAYAQPEPVQTQTYAEPAPSLLNQTMVQEPAPTQASQALADLLDDLDI